jgi:hypothetical protein
MYLARRLRIDKQIKSYYDLFVSELINTLINYDNLAEILNYFDDKKRDFARLEKRTDKTNSSKEINKNIKDNFAVYANNWFNHCSVILNKRNDASRRAIVSKLIGELNLEAWLLNNENIIQLFEMIELIPFKDISLEFMYSLERLYLSPRLQETWKYSCLEKISQRYATDNLNHSNLLIHAIPNPLTWHQIKFNLKSFNTKTQMQFDLKKLLQAFVRVNFKNSSTVDEELRRLAEYLFCCLCKSRKEQADEGVLFNSVDSPFSTSTLHHGINFVLRVLETNKGDSAAALLKISLEVLNDSVRKGKIFFLTPADKKLEKDFSDTMVESVSLSSSEQYLLYWKHFDNSLYDQNPKSALQELHLACIYLVHSAARKRLAKYIYLNH